MALISIPPLFPSPKISTKIDELSNISNLEVLMNTPPLFPIPLPSILLKIRLKSDKVILSVALISIFPASPCV